MKKNIVFCLLLLVAACNIHAKDSFKVLQLNLWHGMTKVDESYQCLVDLLKTTDPDVVFFCEIRDGKKFIPKLIEDLKSEGKEYYGESFDLAIGLLTKFKPEKIEKSCIVPGDEGRAMVKLTTNVGGQPMAFYSCHLDYTHYECYLPRGYSGTTWKKIDKPVTDEAEVLKANRQSFRDESIQAFIKEAKVDIAAGRAVVMGGDFNEPSHKDWTEKTKKLWDHNGAVVRWDCSMMLAESGFKDAYREKHPNPVKCPGFTFPAGNKAAPLKDLAWAPEADERDRIDFIYYFPTDKSLKLKESVLVGPKETVLRGQIVENESKDEIFTPSGNWPSDHKGNLVTFKLRKK